jgi:predicted TIM-barrel fold metal-dependent hydrolase
MRSRREELCRQDACFAALYSSPEARLGSVDELLIAMDECGIGLSIIQNIGWASNELCVENNNYILEEAARFPDRLICFCSCQPRDGDAALREIERCAAGGARGIGEMRPDIQGYQLSDLQTMQPLVECLVKHDLVFSSHASEPVGHGYAGKGNIYPQLLYEFARQYPMLKIVAAHLGGGLPFYELMPEVAANLKNLYYDAAALPFLYRPAVIESVCCAAGDNKILFGSDWPLLSQERVLKHIQEAAIPVESYNNIIRYNAVELMGLRQ